MKPYNRIKASHTFHHLAAVFIADNLVGQNFEGLADISNRYCENRGTYRYFHAIHNCESQRNLHQESRALAQFTSKGDDTAYRFHILFYYIHTYASARKLSDGLVCRKTRQHY